MRAWRHRLTLLARLTGLVLALAAAPAQADDPALQPPFGGERPPPLERPESTTVPPPGFEVSADEAVQAAAGADAVREELEETPDATPVPYIRGDRWQVEYVADAGDESRTVAFAVVDGSTGEVVEAWRDHQVSTELARGYEGAIAQKVNAPYVWIPLCLLFVAPFVDFRRPFRLLHLDLLVLLGLGVSLYFLNRAELTASVALVYPVLGYVLVRMLVAGLRPRERSGPLVPVVGIKALAIAAIALACARVALNVADSRVIDVGVAGVVGADRVANGEALYEGGFSEGLDLRGDVYGPVNYLAYVPFEQLWPWEGEWDDVPAAHAAAIAFDLLCALGLLALGRRLRPGFDGRALGLALSFAWLAYPFTLYTMNANANDSLVAALGVGAMLALTSAPARAAFIALAAAAKFGSAALAPLFATGTGERRWRSAAVFTLCFAAVIVATFAAFVPEGGVRELYDRTLGYQATRSSPFSVWGLAPSVDFLQPVARVAAVALALGVAFYPRFKSPVQVAALAATVTIAVQLTAEHWFYFYVVWFLPFVLVALFATQRREAMTDSRA
jgi:Glycosyltransferase family 87